MALEALGQKVVKAAEPLSAKAAKVSEAIRPSGAASKVAEGIKPLNELPASEVQAFYAPYTASPVKPKKIEVNLQKSLEKNNEGVPMSVKVKLLDQGLIRKSLLGDTYEYLRSTGMSHEQALKIMGFSN